MNRAVLIASAALALSACGSVPKPPPAIVDEPDVTVVEKPVPVSCVDPSFPTAEPTFPDTKGARLHVNTPAEDYNLLAAGAPLHTAWEASLWAQVQACR